MVRVRGSAWLRREQGLERAQERRRRLAERQLAEGPRGEDGALPASDHHHHRQQQQQQDVWALRGAARAMVGGQLVYAAASLATNLAVFLQADEDKAADPDEDKAADPAGGPFAVRVGSGLALWTLLAGVCALALLVPHRRRWLLAAYCYGTAMLVALAILAWVVLPLWQSHLGTLPVATARALAAVHGLGCLLSLGSALFVGWQEHARTRRSLRVPKPGPRRGTEDLAAMKKVA